MDKRKDIFNKLGSGIDIAVNGIANLSCLTGIGLGLSYGIGREAIKLSCPESTMTDNTAIAITTGAIALGIVIGGIHTLEKAIDKIRGKKHTANPTSKKRWYDTRLENGPHLMPYLALAAGFGAAASPESIEALSPVEGGAIVRYLYGATIVTITHHILPKNHIF